MTLELIALQMRDRRFEQIFYALKEILRENLRPS